MGNERSSALGLDEWEQDTQVEAPRKVVGSYGNVETILTANEKIRHIQGHSGLNNKELGNIFGVSPRSIQNWASGGTISESNATKITLFYAKMVPLTSLTPKEAKAVLTSRAEGESFIQTFKGSTKQAQTMLVPTPIEARFI